MVMDWWWRVVGGFVLTVQCSSYASVGLSLLFFTRLSKAFNLQMFGWQEENPSSKSRAPKSSSLLFFFFLSLKQKADRFYFFLTESISQRIWVKMTNHWGHKHSEGQTFDALYKGGAVYFFSSRQRHTYNSLDLGVNNGLVYGKSCKALAIIKKKTKKHHQHEVFCFLLGSSVLYSTTKCVCVQMCLEFWPWVREEIRLLSERRSGEKTK